MNNEQETELENRVRAAMSTIADEARTEPSKLLDLAVHPGSKRLEDRRRLAVAAAVLLVLVGGIGWFASQRANQVADVAALPDSSTDGLWIDLPPNTATRLPDAPISGRIGPSAVWTGSEMVVWGGSGLDSQGESPLSDGAAFDPRTGLWRILPDAPIQGRAYAATVWTGSEMIVWGGSQNGQFVGDGAAFDPNANAWRVLSQSPLPPAMKSAVVWTGNEMIIIGGLNADGRAASYDPSTDRWSDIPDAPGPVIPPYPSAVWTGEAVLTTLSFDEPFGPAQLAMYRPDLAEWQIVQAEFSPPMVVNLTGVDLGMVGAEAIGVTTATDGDLPVLDVFGDIGDSIQPRPDSLPATALWAPIWSGHEILFWSGGTVGLALDPVSSEWRSFPAGDLSMRVDGAIVWADNALIAWGGFVSEADGSATAADDGAIYRPAPAPIEEVKNVEPVAEIDTLAGCPDDHPGNRSPGPDGFTDWADFLLHDGRTYIRQLTPSPSADRIGDIIGRVCFELADMSFDGAAPIQEGDAAFLPPGTELRAIEGGNSDLRLVAIVDNEALVYEAFEVPDAEVGQDLIDLSPSIVEVGINSDVDGSRITAIRQPEEVAALVALLAEAPVDLGPRPQFERDGERYFIELVRSDGTSTERAYWIETGELAPGIDLPNEWQLAVREALANR